MYIQDFIRKEKEVGHFTMKNKLIKITGIVAGAVSIFMMSGWSFFEIMVHCKQKNNLNKKKWFRLSHTKINHPRHKFEKEYEEGKAWCREQKMQDCYVKSDDGLLLHGLYLPQRMQSGLFCCVMDIRAAALEILQIS